MLVDSHAHLNFQAFNQDLAEVVSRCQQKDMAVINIGSQSETSQRAIAIAQDGSYQQARFFAAVGIHPIHLGGSELDLLETKEAESRHSKSAAEMFEDISKLVDKPKVVAIGETGLDYFRLADDDQKTKDIQREYFVRQIELAKKNDLPLVLHCRGSKDDPFTAYDELLEILTDYPDVGGVIHCFGADSAMAKRFIDRGFYIGFTGIITFGKKSKDLRQVAVNAPLEKILIETDCPYLAPEPYRGKRNEPIYVEQVAEEVAKLKDVSVDEVIAVTGENAKRLFNLPI